MTRTSLPNFPFSMSKGIRPDPAQGIVTGSLLLKFWGNFPFIQGGSGDEKLFIFFIASVESVGDAGN